MHSASHRAGARSAAPTLQAPHPQHAQERQLRRELAACLVHAVEQRRPSEAQQAFARLQQACSSNSTSSVALPCGVVASSAGTSSSVDPDWLSSNVHVLRDVCGPSVNETIAHSPELLSADLCTWLDFLSGLGVPSPMIAKVCSESPAVVQGSVYTAGTAILFFKSMGYANDDVIRRIVNLYPYLLSKDLERDIHPVVEYLDQAGCRGSHLRQLVWEFPRIFTKDYRRHVRKFQYLSVYGLSLTSRLSDNERLMMRVM